MSKAMPISLFVIFKQFEGLYRPKVLL